MKFTNKVLAATVLVAAAVIAVEANGVTLMIDQVKQRYPWNGLVDIDYTLTLDNGSTFGVDDSLEVLMIDKAQEPAVTNRAITFLQAPLPMTEGAHRITWDANADGVTNYTERAEFSVRIVHYSEAYMVIDVSGGPTTNCYPVDFLNGAPANGFNTEEYKGDKIVLRRIHPGSYIAGSPENPEEAGRNPQREAQHRVALSQPFYIGIFEITQQQYQNVKNSKPSSLQGDNWKFRPVESVTYGDIRGGNWPTVPAPAENSFVGKLLSKCKSRNPSTGEYTDAVTGFDLPTEFQWEYACRAGTTKAFSTTNPFDNTSATAQEDQLKSLGRYVNNQNDGHGESSGHTIVGSYLPNAWGLYDMHGNVWERCRDWVALDVSALKQYRDPTGPDSADERSQRGGSWSRQVNYSRSAFRGGNPADKKLDELGFRLVRVLP